jgi:hypothetical protein
MTEEPPDLSRRDFIEQGMLFTFLAAGARRLCSSAEARAAGLPYRVLDPDQVRTLESLGEVLVPGSAAAGIAHFIDVQLAGPPADSLLMIKYLGLNPPFIDFYKGGSSALNAAARGAFSALGAADAHALVAAMSKGDIKDWKGPPAGLFFFVLRNDAVDVVYGTVKGFESLGVPYMPHIAPPTRWGE